MTFEEILNQAIALLQRQGRVSYRALKRQFDLDEAYVEDLKLELIEVHQVAVDQDNAMLVWIGGATVHPPSAADTVLGWARAPDAAPLTYTPLHITTKREYSLFFKARNRPCMLGVREQFLLNTLGMGGPDDGCCSNPFARSVSRCTPAHRGGAVPARPL
jgi:hypothetical protein